MSNLAVVVKQDSVQKRFAQVLGKSAPSFISSVLTAVNNDPKLQKCEPQSILAAAITAANLRLSVNPDIGQAYLVPYGNKCKFQIGWKGLIQLAQRTGKYKSIIAVSVCEGEIRAFNKFTESIEFGKKTSDRIIGFFARFELQNGFSKSIFWTTEQMEAHALKFSSTFKADRQNRRQNSGWSTNFDAMGRKTILKFLLRHFGPLSTENHSLDFELDSEQTEFAEVDTVIDMPLDTVDETDTFESHANIPISDSDTTLFSKFTSERTSSS